MGLGNNSHDTQQSGNLEILSFSGGNFLTEFISTVFGGWLFFFYEIEVGLDGWLITLVYMIYAIWSAFNSPLLGHYTNRRLRFMSRWGKHFPWILFAAFPWFITLFLIYSPPLSYNQLFIFLWFTVLVCLFSSFSTIFFVHYISLYTKKFRSEQTRRKASGIIGGISFIASGFGSIFPALLIQFNQILSYSMMALSSMIIATGVFILTLPGIRETREKSLSLNNNHQNPPFFKTLKLALKQRNFVVLVLVYFLIMIVMRSVSAAFPYAVKYIIKSPSITIALISLFYLLGAVISMPIWTKLGNKLNNNRKILIITGILLILSQLFLTFIWNLSSTLPGAFFFGFCLAGFWTVLSLPINAEVLDEIAVQTGERNEPTYMGIRGFFTNFSIVAQSFIFTIIHKATGFIDDAETQTELAQWGIRFTLAFIPMVCMIIALLIFWKIYSLTPEKINFNKKKLEKLNI
jgi:GPH family glycoside/pentoside/hexuronide:cation symporter